MPDNYGAKDHLRPILLGMKPRGINASVFEDMVVAVTVPVPRRSSSTEGSDEMDS